MPAPFLTPSTSAAIPLRSVTALPLRLLQSILLSDDTTDSDTDSDDSDFSLSREELHDMLRLHRYTRQHQSKFHSDREVQTHTDAHAHIGSVVFFWSVYTYTYVCVYFSYSFTNTSTTAPDSSPPMTRSMSSSATYRARRRRKSKMRRNSRVKVKNKESLGHVGGVS